MAVASRASRTDVVTLTTFVIRPESVADALAVDALLRAAFDGDEETAIARRLRTAPGVRLVAVLDGQVIGVVYASPAAVDGCDVGGWTLGPMAVHPDRQRLGVGSALVRAALRHLSSAAFTALVGEPGFYGRFGFVSAAEHGLACEWGGVPEAYWLVQLPSGRAPATGVVQYARAFHGDG